jgi:hypothetical protein
MSLKRRALQRGHKLQKQRDLLLILTNGKNTEKNYFNSLKNHFESVYKLQVKFVGGDAFHLVQDAIIERNNNKQLNQVWCVFDIDDSYVEGKLIEALKLAKKENVHIAYSNEAFEVWLLFHHLSYVEIGQVRRSEYKKKMNSLLKQIRLNENYSKENSTAQTITEKFIPNIKTASQNARISFERKLAQHIRGNGSYSDPRFWEWLTTSTVYKLIDELRLTGKKD